MFGHLWPSIIFFSDIILVRHAKILPRVANGKGPVGKCIIEMGLALLYNASMNNT